MVKLGDESTGKSELQRGNELLHDELFRELISKAVDEHAKRIRDDAGNVEYDQMPADIKLELVELQAVLLLLENPEDSAAYRVSSTYSAKYISYAPKEDIDGERLKVSKSRDGESPNPTWQLSVRISKYSPDPYRHTPEEIIVDTPETTVTVMPEGIYADSDGTKFKRGTGVTMDFYTGGHVEIFGAKGAANSILYTTREPIHVIDDLSIARIIKMLEF